MRGDHIRWVLAFDSGCGRCQALSRSVFAAGGGRLEILPLSSAEVQGWVTLARPDSALRWAPTVFRVRGASVQLWQGPALGLRLAAHLGPRATIRVLRALGAASRTPDAAGSVQSDGQATSRRRFLEWSAGGMLAAGILLAGAAPAAADPAVTWLRSNRDRLPRTYDEMALLPEAYRRAVYQELTPAERSSAWLAQLTAYRAMVPSASRRQVEVLDDAVAIAGDPNNFRDDHVPGKDIPLLANRSIEAFGVDRARDIFATLGAPDSPLAPAATCSCSTASSYCGGSCRAGGCTPVSPGCGFLYQYTCNGRCV